MTRLSFVLTRLNPLNSGLASMRIELEIFVGFQREKFTKSIGIVRAVFVMSFIVYVWIFGAENVQFRSSLIGLLEGLVRKVDTVGVFSK